MIFPPRNNWQLMSSFYSSENDIRLLQMPTFFQMLPPHTTAKLFTFVCLLIKIDLQSIYHSSYEEAEGFSLS